MGLLGRGGAGPRLCLGLVMGAYLGLACCYALLTPVDNAPDESAHRVYVQWLAENRRLPVFDPADAQHYELHQPPLYYALCLPAYLAGGDGVETERVTRAMRFVNVILGLALVLLTFGFTAHMLPDKPWAVLGATAFAAFLPMQVALCASLNNDVLTDVLIAGALWLLAIQLRAGRQPREKGKDGDGSRAKRGRRAKPNARVQTEPEEQEWVRSDTGGFTPWRMAAVGALAGLGLLTKTQAVFLLPVIWLAVLVGWWNRDVPVKRAVGLAAVATGVSLAVGGWWLVRNQLLYGDPLAMRVFLQAFVSTRPTPETMMAAAHLTPTQYAVQWVLPWTFKSFWGMFGPSAAGRFAFYPAWTYRLLGAFTLAAVAGVGLWLFREPRVAWQRRALLPAAFLGALVVASFVRFNVTFFQAQGRYLLPALPLWAVLFAVGVGSLAPPRARPLLALAVSLLMLALSVGGIAVIMLQLVPPAPDIRSWR